MALWLFTVFVRLRFGVWRLQRCERGLVGTIIYGIFALFLIYIAAVCLNPLCLSDIRYRTLLVYLASYLAPSQ